MLKSYINLPARSCAFKGGALWSDLYVIKIGRAYSARPVTRSLCSWCDQRLMLEMLIFHPYICFRGQLKIWHSNHVGFFFFFGIEILFTCTTMHLICKGFPKCLFLNICLMPQVLHILSDSLLCVGSFQWISWRVCSQLRFVMKNGLLNTRITAIVLSTHESNLFLVNSRYFNQLCNQCFLKKNNLQKHFNQTMYINLNANHILVLND